MKSKKDAPHQPSVLSEMDTPQGDLDDQAGTEHVNGDTSWTSRLLKVRSDLGETVNRLRSDLAQLDAAETTERARLWIREHPGLSLGLALGTGFLAGTLLGRRLAPAPPPLSKQVRKRTETLLRRAGKGVEQLGTELAARSVDAGTRVVREVVEKGEDMRRKAEHLVEEQVAGFKEHARTNVQRTYGLMATLLDTLRTAVLVAFVSRVKSWLYPFDRRAS
ncbi:MAG: hypothetical protein KatS3mg044_1238 [Rhodothermaceae bacterium]|nr:MAG: hypothetical protein KatS3mg044_1238 [Rhodothermaceae bacterium]